MTVQELFNTIGFPAIAEALRHTHRNDKSTECLTGYKEAFDILCNIPFNGCGGAVTFDVTPRERLDDEESLPLLANNVEGDYWENIVGKAVVRPDNNPFTDAELAGAILWGATFYGFTPHDRWNPFEKIYSKYGEMAERLERRLYLPYLRNKRTIAQLRDYSVSAHFAVAFTTEEWDYIHFRQRHQNSTKRKRFHRLEKRIERLHKLDKRQQLIDGLENGGVAVSDEIVATIFNAKNICENRYESHTFGKSDRVDYLVDLLLNRDYYPNTKTFLSDGDKFICIVYSSSAHPLTDDELSRLNRLFTTYFAEMSINWQLISATDDSMGGEIALKHLCIEK